MGAITWGTLTPTERAVKDWAFWWPADTRPEDRQRYLDDWPNATVLQRWGLLPLKSSGVLIQAGGCNGLYPLAQSRCYSRVITFEPNTLNYFCLRENLRGVDNVTALNAALYNIDGYAMFQKKRCQTGRLHQEADYEVRCRTIDSVVWGGGGCPKVAAIQLDVEGTELAALEGAEGVLHKDRPILQIEELSLEHQFEVQSFLQKFGYRPLPVKAGWDRIYVYRGGPDG